MNFLSRFKIAPRIIALAFLPIIVIGVLTLNQYRHASAERERIAELTSLMALAKEAGTLMNTIQDERDLANGFLARENNVVGPKGDYFGSQGNDFQADMQRQRQVVNRQIQEFKTYVSLNNKAYQSMPSVLAVLDRLNESLAAMVAVRDKIDQYLILDGKVWTLTVYDSTSERFFRLFEAIVRIASDDPELSLLTNAYLALVNLGDRYSVERGVVARASYMAELDYNIYAREKTTRQEISNLIARFNAYADEALRQEFTRQHLQSSAVQQVIADWKAYRDSAGKKLPFDAKTWYPRASANIDSLNRFKDQLALQIVEKADQLYQQAAAKVWQSLLLFFGICVAVGVVSYFIIMSIIRPLKRLVRQLTHVAEHKDLNYQLDVAGNDELSDVAKAADSLLTSFHSALAGVLEVEMKMKQLTSNVLQSMTISQQRAENQNRNTDGVSVAMNEMTASVGEVSVSAQLTSDAVQRLHDMSVKSADSANTSKDIMERLTSELDSATQMVESVNEESNAIGAVINVIQDIAEQTNLLALNAAIEAARAGEQGRGFAVVADEVRSLASRTQESTGHIKQQIEALQNGAHTVTTTMDRLKGQGSEAVAVVVETLGAFEVLQQELDNIAQMSTQIATAAEQQSVTSGDINRQIHEIKSDSDEMTTHVKSTQVASNELDQTAEILDSYVSAFQLKQAS
ncbi:methyl-accepting chemotaxis protein [Neiella sp. HB171785]|uniref:Methyl-accepting chemotaxis protein n=1 Tax=Neiella litorisoli TaxID=2771431 RepID=A0A8J6QP34_9GAMM|nr:methyl-accepting chemotaxis protein [Neiella litorisoli]MBD1388341.1 methyl-accepting chemotaxis protein [Neiella litorisoli]